MSALAEALIAAQLELPTAIPRDSQGNGYRYTSLDALIAATRPVLNAHGLAISQWLDVLVVGEKAVPTLVTRLDWFGWTGSTEGVRHDERSEHIEYRAPLYVSEPKDSQAAGTATTYMRRYSWAAALGIASEEDTDAATHEPREDDNIPF